MDNIRNHINDSFYRRAFKNSHFSSYDFNITNVSIYSAVSSMLHLNILPFLVPLYENSGVDSFCFIDKIVSPEDAADIASSKFSYKILPSIINGNKITKEHVSMFGGKVVVIVDMNLLARVEDMISVLDDALESRPCGVVIRLRDSISNSGQYYTQLLERIRYQTNRCKTFITGILDDDKTIDDNHGYDYLVFTGVTSYATLGVVGNLYVATCNTYDEAFTLRSSSNGHIYFYVSTTSKVSTKYNLLDNSHISSNGNCVEEVAGLIRECRLLQTIITKVSS